MNKLKEMIKARGLRQKWVADQVGVTDVCLSYWVNNHRQPRGLNMAKLEIVLNCTGRDIYGI